MKLGLCICEGFNTLYFVSMSADTLFGYEIPMPKSDLFTALATVCGFIPVVIIVHQVVAFLLSFVRKPHKA